MKLNILDSGDTAMTLGNYLLQRASDKRVIATCSRKCDAKYLARCADDREFVELISTLGGYSGSGFSCGASESQIRRSDDNQSQE